MMKAEKKARGLVNNFNQFDLSHFEKKQCALFCVDETYEAIADFYTEAMDKRGFNENLDYWNEVKQEINKL